MEPDSAPPSRFGASFRRVSATVLGMLRNRIELFALELQEEKYWLISTLVWGAATVFFGGVTILLVVGAVVFLAPESARGWILLGFAVAFSFITVNAVAALRRSLRNRPPPLSDTLGELRKDLDWIQSQD